MELIKSKRAASSSKSAWLADRCFTGWVEVNLLDNMCFGGNPIESLYAKYIVQVLRKN